MLKLGVLASGRGSNLQSIIDSINQGYLDARIVIVISDNKGAGALVRAEKDGIDSVFIDPENFDSKQEYENELIKIMEEKGVELVIMAGFMRLLSPHIIKHFRHRIMNIHPSLLPAFPGLDAQEQALEYGVKVSGCTVHFADEGMDTGPIILQQAVPVKEGDTVEELSARILKEEHKLFPEAIKLYSENRLEIEDNKVKIK